ncbi:putative membrane protein [Wolbachia endosymbiont of Trichogramma pretiosum]|nr:putative membrane protein [Wolbachia endosymbiont of Trichogramma pretiosum]
MPSLYALYFINKIGLNIIYLLIRIVNFYRKDLGVKYYNIIKVDG